MPSMLKLLKGQMRGGGGAVLGEDREEGAREGGFT